jgi:hypothetical protein
MVKHPKKEEIDMESGRLKYAALFLFMEESHEEAKDD